MVEEDDRVAARQRQLHTSTFHIHFGFSIFSVLCDAVRRQNPGGQRETTTETKTQAERKGER